MTSSYLLDSYALLSFFQERAGAEVVAEFVENQEIQHIVEEIGIHFSQGYHFSKPGKDIFFQNESG